MTSILDWLALVPVTFGTLAYYAGKAWFQRARTRANVLECGDPPSPRFELQPPSWFRDDRPDCPTDPDWCPAHECEIADGTECPGCRDEWESTWALGEEPFERDAWADSEEERWAAAEADGDGWYLDLVARADFRHDGWREGGAL
jgi:hypothetical protein